jgi:hypothetical protein
MNPQPPPPPPMTFDKKLDEIFKTAANSAFLTVPELRSVVVLYDYYDNLNDAQVSKGVWLHTTGGKDKPADSLIGSMGAVVQGLAHIVDECLQRKMTLQAELTALTAQLVEKHAAKTQ